MHVTDLQQLGDTYDQVYLSPHLDDAALSCGGAIARSTAEGKRVLVVNICTAIPAPDTDFSDFAVAMHTSWQLGPAEVVTRRLVEDAQALALLGADSYSVGLLDAIYRQPEAYNSNERLFGTPVANDPLGPAVAQLIARLLDRFPQATFYAPLGVGRHVDHQLTHTAAVADPRLSKLVFYEDFPYVASPGALERLLAALGRQFVPSIVAIDETLQQKIHAVEMYASQLNELFGGLEPMRALVTSYAREHHASTGTYGERVWLPVAPEEAA